MLISSCEDDKVIDHNLAFQGVKRGKGRGRGRGRGESMQLPNFNSQGHGFIPYDKQ